MSAEGRRWRVGRKVGRTIYAQTGAEPSDDDMLIGVMDLPSVAEHVVDCHNARLEQPWTGWVYVGADEESDEELPSLASLVGSLPDARRQIIDVEDAP